MSKPLLKVIDAGRVGYSEMLQRQLALFDAMVADKRNGGSHNEEYLILVEHDPVFTLGKHGHAENMLAARTDLAARGVDVVRTTRGGDITFHGPGQLVVYPILDLEVHHLGVKDYVDLLEEAVIRTIATYGITGERVEGATGVWIGKDTPGERKICAIGVKCSRFVTMHGLALNVNTDLTWFKLINPCGFTDKGVTSIARELTIHPNADTIITHNQSTTSDQSSTINPDQSSAINPDQSSAINPDQYIDMQSVKSHFTAIFKELLPRP